MIIKEGDFMRFRKGTDIYRLINIQITQQRNGSKFITGILCGVKPRGKIGTCYLKDMVKVATTQEEENFINLLFA